MNKPGFGDAQREGRDVAWSPAVLLLPSLLAFRHHFRRTEKARRGPYGTPVVKTLLPGRGHGLAPGQGAELLGCGVGGLDHHGTAAAVRYAGAGGSGDLFTPSCP